MHQRPGEWAIDLDGPELIRVALTRNPYVGADVLGISYSQPVGRSEYVALIRTVRQRFDFDAAALRAYIRSRPGVALRLLDDALDTRSDCAPYLEGTVDGGYEVGFYHHGASRRRDHHGLDNAATDFVLLSWGLPRYPYPGPYDDWTGTPEYRPEPPFSVHRTVVELLLLTILTLLRRPR